MRKTMFDDCKGEKFQELLAAFSTIVLRKVLAEGDGGKASIAGRLAAAKRITKTEHESLLPLAIAHRSSLTALLNRKRELSARYKTFGNILSSKDKELDQKFECIVKTQGLLDESLIPDHTVSRVSKFFEEHWQGDAGLLDVIAQGEEQRSKDALLDEPFREIWSEVSIRAFDGFTGLNSHGLLEDLEKRVASQEARLKQWREFKEVMKKDIKPTIGSEVQSPTSIKFKGVNPVLHRQRDLMFSPRKSPRKNNREIEKEEESPSVMLRKSHQADLHKERDYVFSPRKSPRKSDWEVKGAEKQMSLSSPSSIYVKNNEATPIPNANMMKYPKNSDASNAAHEGQRMSHSSDSHLESSRDESDNSGFSEISGGHLHYGEKSVDIARVKDLSNYTQNGEMGHEYNQRDPSESHDRKLHQDDRLCSMQNGGNINDDELLAEQVISMTLNAAPTPAKPFLSLMQRTRQSIMASSSPGGLQRLTTNDHDSQSPLLTAIADEQKPSSTRLNGPTTLLERTRQSISLVPSRPSGPRKSMHERRTSKVYPTNQFETPRKEMPMIEEFTPPEELFSPGAGYDSVFKSRPRVGFSPIASPVPDESRGESVDEEMNGNRWVESPSARASAEV